MSTQTIPEKLAPLFEYLDGLTRRAPIDELKEHIRAVDIRVDDVREFVRFSDEQYLRHLIRGTDWYHALVLCWRSGQRSPIHNHARSTCGLRVLAGTATETIFKPTPSTLIHPVSSTDLSVGTVAASHDADIHQVSNLQEPGNDLITFHVYSPPLLRMDTYSLTDRALGEFRPMILEHAQGSGI